MTKIDDIYE
jgi:hypothetical protein